MSGNAKKRINYECKTCDFFTCNKTDYNRHLNTVKHLGNVLDTKNADPITYKCDSCGRRYVNNSGLWKHKKICDTTDEPNDKQLIMTLVKQNSELHAKVIELCKTGITNNINTTNTTNSHNKTFNLQFFLNETCKGAMNLTDFVDSVVLQLADLDTIGNTGFVNGMSNIIISNLNLLAENKRPIHCTDAKREVIYVKDENKWEKDANKEKMRLLIKKMDKKLAPLMIAFTNQHNKTYRTDSEIIKHQKIIYEVVGGSMDDDSNQDAIIQRISKNTIIEKAIHV